MFAQNLTIFDALRALEGEIQLKKSAQRYSQKQANPAGLESAYDLTL